MTRTNAYSVLCVFIRTFALWVFLVPIVAMPAIFRTASEWDPQSKWIYFLTGTALPMIVAALVWIFADKLAKLALARPQQIVFESDIAASEWQAIAFSVVGLWQAFGGIIGLTIHLAGMLVARPDVTFAGGAAAWLARFIEEVAASSVQLILGLILLFGARGLVGLIRRYRQFGYTHTDTSEASDSGETRSTKPDPNPPT